MLCAGSFLVAQNNIAINATGANALPSAILDVSSTTGGMLTPRMTQAERLAIASPVDGLILFQTDAAQGYWYWDGGAAVPGWRRMSKYLSGSVEMGPAPSTILQGNGFTVTRLVDGTDQITFNTPYAGVPNVIVSNADAFGESPFLTDYCAVSFTSCVCHHIVDFALYGDAVVGGTPLISNFNSGCNTEPGRSIYYPPGHPVYQNNPVDICLGSPSQFSLELYGNVPGSGTPAPCGTHHTFVYIDWQQDGFFDQFDDEVLATGQVVWSGVSDPPVPFNGFSIPAGAFSGDTFVRVTALPGLASNSCASGPLGENEEYRISVSCGTVPVYDDVGTYCNAGDITPLGFRVSCRRLGGESRNAQNYYFQVNEY
jgi:hypothetical protein